jgi:hypothetical protein
VAGATPCPKMGCSATPCPSKGWLNHPMPKQGVAEPPHFWPRGGFGHPIRPVWGGRSHPERPPRKKKKKTKWVCVVGGGPTTPKGLGVVVGGGRSHPMPLGVVRPPPTAQTHFIFLGGGLSGWPDYPQRPGGGFGHPIRLVWGGRSHPLAKNGVVRPPHFWARGVALATPDFPPFFFFFFFKKK